MDMVFFNLNDLEKTGVIECPYCEKGKNFSYGAKGKSSSACRNCGRIVLWDFDRLKAYKAYPRNHAS